MYHSYVDYIVPYIFASDCAKVGVSDGEIDGLYVETLETTFGLYFGALLDEVSVLLCDFVGDLECDEVVLIVGSQIDAIIGSDIDIGNGFNLCANVGVDVILPNKTYPLYINANEYMYIFLLTETNVSTINLN